MKTQIIGLKEFRTGITQLWKRAKAENRRFIVLHHSRPVLKVEPIEDGVTIEEVLEQSVDSLEEQEEVAVGSVQVLPGGVQVIDIVPDRTKANGVWYVAQAHVDVIVPFTVAEQTIVSLTPGVVGGNHQHPRAEAFAVLGEGLVFNWLDADGKLHSVDMYGECGRMVIVPPMVSHAIQHVGQNPVVLIEYADGPPERFEYIEVVNQ